MTTGLKKLFVRGLDLTLGHQAVYDEGYFRETIEPSAVASAAAMAESMVRDLAPRTVLDVGCGTGALLEGLRNRGCSVAGLERAGAALEFCRRRGIAVREFDVERDALPPADRFDLVVSFEVAEHLPPHAADRLMELLTLASSNVAMSAARPGQGGLDHVNEQPPEYWIEKFQARGFVESVQLRNRWRAEWASKQVARWYWENLLVFAASGTALQDHA